MVHELSICQALLSQVAEIARNRGALAVERITIELGPLCGVEPDLLQNAFAVMRLGGVARDAALVFEPVAVCVSCIECGAKTQTRANRLTCAACGGFRTRLVSGNELRLRQVEMRVPENLLASTA
jgi:hydrogenase nickel incorporation protein HypA/HybF